jgi:hypothetical protein
MITVMGCDDVVLQWDYRPAATIAMPISHQIVCNSIKPGREWDALILEVGYVPQRTLKYSGGQILGIMVITGPVIYIVIDPAHMALIKNTECIGIGSSFPNQFHIVDLRFGHAILCLMVDGLMLETPSIPLRFFIISIKYQRKITALW